MLTPTGSETATSFTLGESAGFNVTLVSDKGAIDANNQYFGDANAQVNFTTRWKSGGKSGTGRYITVNIPSEGTLKVYARNASSSDATRTLVLTQGSTELYNAVVKDADAIKVTMSIDAQEIEKSVFPVISVPVTSGTVNVTWPVNSLNFYGFEFVSKTGISSIITPEANANAPIYNLAGQQVSKDYKGVCIQNGKKFINK